MSEEAQCYGCAHGEDVLVDEERDLRVHVFWDFGPQHETGKAFMVHPCLTALRAEHKALWRAARGE